MPKEGCPSSFWYDNDSGHKDLLAWSHPNVMIPLMKNVSFSTGTYWCWMINSGFYQSPRPCSPNNAPWEDLYSIYNIRCFSKNLIHCKKYILLQGKRNSSPFHLPILNRSEGVQRRSRTDYCGVVSYMHVRGFFFGGVYHDNNKVPKEVLAWQGSQEFLSLLKKVDNVLLWSS